MSWTVGAVRIGNVIVKQPPWPVVTPREVLELELVRLLLPQQQDAYRVTFEGVWASWP